MVLTAKQLADMDNISGLSNNKIAEMDAIVNQEKQPESPVAVSRISNDSHQYNPVHPEVQPLWGGFGDIWKGVKKGAVSIPIGIANIPSMIKNVDTAGQNAFNYAKNKVIGTNTPSKEYSPLWLENPMPEPVSAAGKVADLGASLAIPSLVGKVGEALRLGKVASKLSKPYDRAKQAETAIQDLTKEQQATRRAYEDTMLKYKSSENFQKSKPVTELNNEKYIPKVEEATRKYPEQLKKGLKTEYDNMLGEGDNYSVLGSKDIDIKDEYEQLMKLQKYKEINDINIPFANKTTNIIKSLKDLSKPAENIAHDTGLVNEFGNPLTAIEKTKAIKPITKFKDTHWLADMLDDEVKRLYNDRSTASLANELSKVVKSLKNKLDVSSGDTGYRELGSRYRQYKLMDQNVNTGIGRILERPEFKERQGVSSLISNIDKLSEKSKSVLNATQNKKIFATRSLGDNLKLNGFNKEAKELESIVNAIENESLKAKRINNVTQKIIDRIAKQKESTTNKFNAGKRITEDKLQQEAQHLPKGSVVPSVSELALKNVPVSGFAKAFLNAGTSGKSKMIAGKSLSYPFSGMDKTNKFLQKNKLIQLLAAEQNRQGGNE